MKFRLKSLLWMVGAIALVLAPIAPWYRGMHEWQQATFLWLLVMTGFGMATGVIAFLLFRFLALRRLGECLIRLPPAQRATSLSIGLFMMFMSGFMICMTVHTAVWRQSEQPKPDEGMDSFKVLMDGMLFAQGIAFGLLQLFGQVEICQRGLLFNGVACKKWKSVTQVGWVKESGFLRLYFGSFDTTHNVPIDQRDLVGRILADAGKFPEPTPFE
jgi:hypothetical protein